MNCPRCGAEPYGCGFYKCGSTDEGFDKKDPHEYVSKACLHAALAAANERAAKLEAEREDLRQAWQAKTDSTEPRKWIKTYMSDSEYETLDRILAPLPAAPDGVGEK